MNHVLIYYLINILGIWKACGRPHEVQVYLCYNFAKKLYRSTCNQAMNGSLNQLSSNLNTLYRGRNLKKFWNLIRSTKTQRSSYDDIDMSKLKKYFNIKFSESQCISDVIKNAEREVQIKFDSLQCTTCNDKVMSTTMVTTYIKKLNSGSAPGIDGIMAEHLKYALNSRIVNHISVMLSICFKYGIVPASFSQGLLVPLLKKPTLDPTHC